MKNKEIEKNLKHGYTFLISTLFLVVVTPIVIVNKDRIISYDYYRIVTKSKNQKSLSDNKKDPSVRVLNLWDSYKTQEPRVTAYIEAKDCEKVFINNKEFKCSESQIEYEFDLIVGENILALKVEDKEQKLSIFREDTAPEPSEDTDVIAIQDPLPITDPVYIPDPEPQPQTNPQPQPEPSITTLNLDCTIINSYPREGETVTFNCSVTDQNYSGVNGATGSLTINWRSGASQYSLPASSGGNTSYTVTVPSGNSSANIYCSISVFKDGLNAVANFSFNVQ